VGDERRGARLPTQDRRDAGGSGRAADYRVARISAALTLTVVIAVLAVGRLVMGRPDSDVPEMVVLGVMVLTLLGLEARDLLRGG